MEKKQKRSSSLNQLKLKQISFEDYIIKETIGKGTFSKVKLGINKITGEKVAIKILDKSKIVEKEDLERIVREMSILSKMDHKNVIKVFQIYEDSNNFLIIMEYCEGGELFNYIVKKGRLSEEEASFFFYQIVNGVEYIFSKGVAHRDLKPENLLLTHNNIIKIIDFGLSNYFDGENDLITPCGSPCYASPEMVSGKNYNGFNIDIWATGIILFAMVCGYLPFENPDNDKLFELILKAELDFPEHLSEICKDLIKKILVTDPNKRINIEQIKKHKFYLMGKENYDKLLNKAKKNNKIKFKKHNSDNYLTNINIKDTNNNNNDINDFIKNNKTKKELKTINNNIFTEKDNILNADNIKANLKIAKENKNENSENTKKAKNYIISNRIVKYKLNGFKISKGFSNFIKNENSHKGLITEANINKNPENKFNNNFYINTIKNSNRSREKTKLFLNQKINIHKLNGIKKLPLKFNLTDLINNYINTKIFSRIKNSKINKNNKMNIDLINSMNNKTKPLIIDNAFINININSNKYIIDNINIKNKNIQRTSTTNNKKIKSKSPAILRFHTFKNKDFPVIKNEDKLKLIKKNDNKMKAILSNGLRLKTDYNNYKNNIDYVEPNLKTFQNILNNKDKCEHKLNNKLKFNKIYSFFH